MKKKNLTKFSLITIKLLLIVGIMLLVFGTKNDNFSNSINLLSVNKDIEGNVLGGKLIPLNLEVKSGTGEVYIHSNGILEVDTQLSIRNSKDIVCQIFDIKCNKYDFYYSFSQDNLVLEGPSAGAAIGILTAKTVMKEKLLSESVITGSLGSGGVVGIVGGIEEKILLAEEFGFDKVMIPYFGVYNESKIKKIEVIKVLDIVDVYNEFGSQKFSLKTNEVKKGEYEKLMKSLSEKLCQRSQDLKKVIGDFEENSTKGILYKRAQDNLNSSEIANLRESYYSSGSFCFGANNNLRVISELNNNFSYDEIENKLKELKSQINLDFVRINSNDFKDNISTINDFYVWLILNDRIYEAKELVENVLDDKESFNLNEIIKNNSKNNQTNLNLTINKSQDEINLLVSSYSFAKERLYTVDLWKEFIVHEGKNIAFDTSTLNRACNNLKNEIRLKSQVLNQYEISFFNSEIDDLISLTENSQNVLCIYKSLELNGRIDTVISSVGMSQNSSEEFSEELYKLAKSRLSLNSEENFPLIPFIYFDYAEELYKQEDFGSSLLYTNYALSFGNLDLYLQKEKTPREVIQKSYRDIIIHPIFIFALLLMLGFIA